MRALTRRGCQRLRYRCRDRAAASPLNTYADGRRGIQIQAAPSSDSSGVVENPPGLASTPDAVFEVVGTPYSILSATLSPSQSLHSRRGTLVGLSGDPTTTISTLRFLSPFRRALVGIPFLYQRLTSATPVTALIAPKSTCTSLAVLHLTGTTDWKIAQANALLAWTGSTLVLHPTIRDFLSLAPSSWGSTTCTGRGLLALEGKGTIFSITLSENESYIAHPSNVLAYTLSSPSSSSSSSSTTTPNSPTPYRFKSSPFTLSIPSPYNFTTFFPQSRFITNMKDSDTYQIVSKLLQRVRTWSRRTIWGDRLFHHFTGPSTIIVQSRASRLRDALSDKDVNDIAEVPAGTVKKIQRTGGLGKGEKEGESKTAITPRTGLETTIRKPSKLSIASVQRDGRVRIEQTTDFEQLKQ